MGNDGCVICGSGIEGQGRTGHLCVPGQFVHLAGIDHFQKQPSKSIFPCMKGHYNITCTPTCSQSPHEMAFGAILSFFMSCISAWNRRAGSFDFIGVMEYVFNSSLRLFFFLCFYTSCESKKASRQQIEGLLNPNTETCMDWEHKHMNTFI